jgi:hypothetical protein
METRIMVCIGESQIDVSDQENNEISEILSNARKVTVVCISGRYYSHFKHLSVCELSEDPSALSCTFFTKFVPIENIVNSILALALTSYATLEQVCCLMGGCIADGIVNAFIFGENGLLLGGIELFCEGSKYFLEVIK